MTQQVCLARVTFPSVSPPFDGASNDFVIEATGSDTTLDFGTSQTPQAAIEAFYNSALGTEPLGYYMSNDISRSTNGCEITWYDVTASLATGALGSPIRMDTFTLTAAGSTEPQPPQVACTIGYRSDYGGTSEHSAGTRPRARHRGRLFLGPFSVNCLASSHGVPTPGFLSDVAAAAALTFGTHNPLSANQFNFVQWSRKDGAVRNISEYYVDEYFSTIRLRTDTTASRTHSWVPF